jgi:chromosome segregation ATPase
MTVEPSINLDGAVHERIAAIAASVTELDALLQELVALRDRLNGVERDAADSRAALQRAASVAGEQLTSLSERTLQQTAALEQLEGRRAQLESALDKAEAGLAERLTAARERLDALLTAFTRGISSLIEERRSATIDTLSRLDALKSDLSELLAITREGLVESRAHRRDLRDLQNTLTGRLDMLTAEHLHLENSLNSAVQALKSALQAHHADLAAHLAGTRGDVTAVLQVAIRLENAHRTNHEATQRAFAQQTTTIQSALAAAAQRHL